MPDEHDRWLDRETAERLLRGERLGAGEPTAARDLARMLESLSAAPVDHADPAADGMAGEDAALAAFRAARAARGAAGADTPDTLGAALPVRGRARRGPDGRRGRGVARHRFVLAAVLVTGVVGGGAALGGGLHGFVSGDRAPAGSVATGLPAPSGTSTPVPLGSETPAVPLPEDSVAGVTGGVGVRPSSGGDASADGPGTEGRGRSGAAGHGDATDPDGAGDAHDGRSAAGAGGSSGGQSGNRGHGSREALRDACRDHLAGRSLTARQRRVLEAAAGSDGVSAYCVGLVGDGGGAPADGSPKRDEDRDGKADGDSDDGKDGKGSDRRRERDDSAGNGRRTGGDGPAAGVRGRGAGTGGGGRARGTSADDRASRPTAGSPAGRGSGRERAAEPVAAGRRG